MQDTDYKEVFFNEYCEKCTYGTIPENQEPCSECLEEPINLHSHKPVKFEPSGKWSIGPYYPGGTIIQPDKPVKPTPDPDLDLDPYKAK